ncbi:MAG: tetratricopeptide repeat protein [Pseudomonadota bacterium]
MAITYHQLGSVAQDRGALDEAEAWYRKALEIREAIGDRAGMAKTYHQLGIVAQSRGALDEAEAWYRKSLEIEEALGDRPSLAVTYGQLGLLAEARGDADLALQWTIRCITLFDAFGHPATGPAPNHLARLTKTHGADALADAWRTITGAPPPEGLVEALKETGRDE